MPHDHSCDKLKQNISFFARPATNQVGRVVTYDEGNSPIPHDQLTALSLEVTSQNKSLISPLPQGL